MTLGRRGTFACPQNWRQVARMFHKAGVVALGRKRILYPVTNALMPIAAFTWMTLGSNLYITCKNPECGDKLAIMVLVRWAKQKIINVRN
jgi:hypothetical protein